MNNYIFEKVCFGPCTILLLYYDFKLLLNMPKIICLYYDPVVNFYGSYK